jgi:hypothetical protein
LGAYRLMAAQVDRYNALLNELTKTMFDIHRNYISVNAPNQLNLSENMLLKINKDLRATLTATFPKLESIFINPQNEIEQIVSSDIYPRFVRHQLTMSATKALAGNRSKYAGLGDCFVLTNPAIADNPIVHASDGFVKVTGYPRTEIIPRNCRFLQGKHTDRQSVKQIKTGIDGRRESVELLLNYKKNGEPFWNLLYISKIYAPTSPHSSRRVRADYAFQLRYSTPTATSSFSSAARSTAPQRSTAVPTSCASSLCRKMWTKIMSPRWPFRRAIPP